MIEPSEPLFTIQTVSLTPNETYPDLMIREPHLTFKVNFEIKRESGGVRGFPTSVILILAAAAAYFYLMDGDLSSI